MPQPMSFHLRLGWSGWLRLLIVIGLVLAITAAVAVLLFGLFVILLPVVLIGVLLAYLFPSLRRRPPGENPDADIIEGEYRVVEPGRLEHDPPPGDKP